MSDRGLAYVSGPISLGGTSTPQEIATRIAVFHGAEAQLTQEGWGVFSPARIREQPSWEDYMKVCLPAVCSSDAIFVLPDWEASRGARLEVFVARELGLPVHEFLLKVAA